MGIFSPGFVGRRRDANPLLPPGQYEVTNFPVLSAGPTPKVTKDDWALSIRAQDGSVKAWNWATLMQNPIDDITVDLHCVTRWSQFGMGWRGVSLDHLFEGVDTSAQFAMASSYGGYTTNMQTTDLVGSKAWIAFQFDGEDLAPAHGGPARLLVPHLYLWKSAKWINRITLMDHHELGFWEQYGYHDIGDPWKEERYS
ncbi:molybdopterin-dependent oxidoreductase [Subtercola boreus]|uniref:Sulfite oxidase-like oxidoreductase n=1 Tax=Subtercola boreus TaxID=120213 RepID=A0A3E0WGM6_9MICO|nr:molybdopterin-dependent oxidoreductase [Subtercola boreus]RFA23619.1 sulfite oxidase-like oxidoreductase [Subtercola boreus]RFA24013.1 sulfite oxidase-like oxidoreductase [Subtercola boreus]RFA29711.1 sulfite oxidase-like oxidoreductase [Subtercola boreus]